MFCLQSPATLDLTPVNETTATVLSLLPRSDEARAPERTMIRPTDRNDSKQ